MKEIKFDKDEVNYLKSILDKENKISQKIIKKLDRAEKRIKVSSAKGKGRNLQYLVCQKIADIFKVKFDQSDDNSLVQSRPMGQHGVDIILRGFVYEQFPYDVECKCCESLNIPDWINQAKANTKEGRQWLLVIKKQSIGSVIVVMDWESFEKLFRNSKGF